MSRIDDLIAEHCPNGVEYKPLGDVCTVFNGYAFKSGLFNSDRIGLPIIRIRDVNTGFSDTFYSGEYDSRWVVEEGDILIGMDGDFRANRWKHGRALLNQRVCRLQNFSAEMLPDFAYYQIQDVLDRIHGSITGSTVKHLSSRELERSRVPVPPLEVQREIVRILDTFTELEAELKAELEARRRQYEHYRLLLLASSAEGATWSTLGKISTRVSSGATPTAGRSDYYHDGTIPWLRTGEVRFTDIWTTEMRITERALKETATSWIPANCVIVAISGATAARAAVNKIPLATNQHCCNLQIDADRADFRYVFHWVSSKYEELKALGRGARSDLNVKLIKDFPIPVPSVAEQSRVGAILDKFDTLVHDQTIGLPAEVAARRQQYEHYRDRLLTFQEAVS